MRALIVLSVAVAVVGCEETTTVVRQQLTGPQEMRQTELVAEYLPRVRDLKGTRAAELRYTKRQFLTASHPDRRERKSHKL